MTFLIILIGEASAKVLFKPYPNSPNK